MPTDREVLAFDALSDHPRLPDLAALTGALMTKLASADSATRGDDERRAWVAAQAAEKKLTREETDTPFGNALDVLERGPEDPAARALARALAAQALAHEPPGSPADEERASHHLLWLAAHTDLDATDLIDRALGAKAPGLWAAIAERVRRVDGGALPPLGRGEALVGAAALAGSRSAGAADAAAVLGADVEDAKLRRVLDVPATTPRSASAD
jgi:hypothetical protein